MYKIEKDRLLSLIQALDIHAESTILSPAELQVKNEVEKRLKELLRGEELKWALRAKVRKMVQGDANTQFFHLIANGKHRKKSIFQLEQDEGTILGQDNLKTYIIDYYKQLRMCPSYRLPIMIFWLPRFRRRRCLMLLHR